jgi:hypothetical protein
VCVLHINPYVRIIQCIGNVAVQFRVWVEISRRRIVSQLTSLQTPLISAQRLSERRSAESVCEYSGPLTYELNSFPRVGLVSLILRRETRDRSFTAGLINLCLFITIIMCGGACIYWCG